MTNVLRNPTGTPLGKHFAKKCVPGGHPPLCHPDRVAHAIATRGSQGIPPRPCLLPKSASLIRLLPGRLCFQHVNHWNILPLTAEVDKAGPRIFTWPLTA